MKRIQISALLLSIAVFLVFCSSNTIAFGEEKLSSNSEQEKVLKDLALEFFTCYQTRDIEKINQLVDWDSPIIPHNVEGKDDLPTYFAMMQLNPYSSGKEYNKTIVNNMDDLKNEFNLFPYGWVKPEIRGIVKKSEKMALVKAGIFEYGFNPNKGTFFTLEINDYSLVLEKKDDGKWKIFGFGFVFEDIPNNAFFLTYEGDMKLRRDDIDGAIKNFKQAVSINPDLSSAHFELALAYTQDRDWIIKHPEIDIGNESINEVNKAINLRPEVAFYHFFLGKLYESGLEKDMAKKELGLAVELDHNISLLLKPEKTTEKTCNPNMIMSYSANLEMSSF